MAERKVDALAVKGTFAGLLKDRRDSMENRLKKIFGKKDDGDGPDRVSRADDSTEGVVKVGKTYRYVPQGTNGPRK